MSVHSKPPVLIAASAVKSQDAYIGYHPVKVKRYMDDITVQVVSLTKCCEVNLTLAEWRDVVRQIKDSERRGEW